MSQESSVYSQSLATTTCPWLGSVRDRKTKYGFACEQNVCYAPQGPKHPTFPHQEQYCLSAQYESCFFFSAPEVERPNPDNQKLQPPPIARFGIPLAGVAVVALVIAFVARGNLFASGDSSMLAPPGLTPHALAFAVTPTFVPVVSIPTSNSTATPLPSTPTSIPTSTPTTEPPTATPTATPIANTATPVPPTATLVLAATKPPTVALRYAPVVLIEPHNEQQVNGETITFEWQDSRLQIGDHYELWLKRLGSPTWEKRYLVADGKSTLSYRNAMDYGDYAWTVLILDSLGQPVSPIGEERKLLWRPREPGSQNSSSSDPFIKP